MKKIAVIGIGAIGGILGVYLTRGGQDVTLIEPFWQEHTQVMKKDGLTLKDRNGEQTIKVKALFVDELNALQESIEILFVTVKSNDTVKMVELMKPYLAESAWVISPQNGINEDVIIPIVGKGNVIPCVSYTGGRVLKPGYVSGHDGYFVIGELDGRITSRIKELAQILSLVIRTEISNNIMLERWNKLSQVTMTVTVGCILGAGMGIFRYEKAHSLLARVMCENMRVARAAGCELKEVIGIKAEEWEKLARGPVSKLSKKIAGGISLPSGVDMPPDPITISIKSGQPLEINYTNGYVINKGKELGIPTPANDLIVNMIKGIQNGKVKPGLDHLPEMLRLTDNG